MGWHWGQDPVTALEEAQSKDPAEEGRGGGGASSGDTRPLSRGDSGAGEMRRAPARGREGEGGHLLHAASLEQVLAGADQRCREGGGGGYRMHANI